MEHVRTYACIHLDNIKHNLDCIRSVLLPGTKVIAVVKAKLTATAPMRFRGISRRRSRGLRYPI